MKVHYLYCVTRLSDGAFYIGRHSAPSLKNAYMGGGKHITASVRKYGRNAHKKEILQIVSCSKELKILEQSIVNEEMLSNPKCMNIALGGEGGFSISREKLSEQSKRNWKNPEYRQKVLSQLSDGRLSAPITAGLNTPEAKARLSKASIAAWKKPEYREKLKNAGKYERTDSTREKMSILATQRMIANNHTKNTVWMTNGIINKRVTVSVVENFVALGFTKGRK